jgi:RNA polymerase sigma-70 factor (ECF subfamily)
VSADLSLLAARASKGDRAAFEAIVADTQDRLYRLALRMLGATGEAEEALQEAYVKAHRAIAAGRFDGRSDVGTWIYRIVANTALDALRRRKRETPPEPPSFDAPVTPEAKLALVELAGWLDDLAPDQRAAIVLVAIEGLTAPEAALALGCSEDAIEQRVSRGRAALRKRRDRDE